MLHSWGSFERDAERHKPKPERAQRRDLWWRADTSVQQREHDEDRRHHHDHRSRLTVIDLSIIVVSLKPVLP